MNKKYVGSNFDNFLESEGLLEDCRTSAIKVKLTKELKKPRANKTSQNPKAPNDPKTAAPASTARSIPTTPPSP